MSIQQEREALKKRLHSRKHREAFVSASVDQTIPLQVRALRLSRERSWTQEDLALRAGMKQEAISRLESPNYGKFNIRTLKQLAAAFDVGLIVRFAPFSELAEWEINMSPESLEVPHFEQEDYFTEKPISELGTRLLKDNYSHYIGNKQDNDYKSDKAPGAIVELSVVHEQNQRASFAEKSLISIQNKTREDYNEALVG